MRFYSRDGGEITSLEDWRRLGKPAASYHWKPGRSAHELAAEWIGGDGARQVTDLLALRPELAGVELLEGIAEKQTRFDDIPRGPRNHDLLVRGRTNMGSLVVGVEGKADEPFGEPLREWRKAALDRSPHSDAPRRLDNLTTLFFGTTIDEGHAKPPVGAIGYQLVSALAETLADAREADATHAVLLVHEFVTNETDDPKHSENAQDLEHFTKRLAGHELERTETDNGWISEPVTVQGDGAWLPVSLPVFVAKLQVSRRIA